MGCELLSIFEVKFVLSCARKSDIDWNAPNATAILVLNAFATLRIFRDTAALNFLDLLDECHINAVRIIDPASGIRQGNDLSAELLSLLGRIDRNVNDYVQG